MGEPGDFQSDLHSELDFRDGWEVALSDMTYTGQGFKNVPTDKASISVSSRHKNIYDDDYALTWDQTNRWSIQLRHFQVATLSDGMTRRDQFR